MASMDDVKVGKRILVDGQPYEVIKSEHLKVAMGKGMEKCMIINLLTGKTIPMTFHAVDKVEAADIQMRDADYQYFDGTSYHFMDIQNYESYFINADVIGDKKYFLVDGNKTTVMFWDGNPINVQIDPSVTLEIAETPPGEKGNSASNNLKPATTNTGLQLKVPLFIGQGERVRVDSRTYEYLGRDNTLSAEKARSSNSNLRSSLTVLAVRLALVLDSHLNYFVFALFLGIFLLV